VFKTEKGYSMNNYTIGNWTVSDQYLDTVATAKNIPVPDLTYASDFQKTVDTPDEALVSNITGPDLMPHETVRFAKSSVSNIYQGVDLVDPGSVAPVKRGVQVMAELVTVYHISNSVTGDEYDLPCKGRIVLRLPSMSCVTDALVSDLLCRTISASFGTGEVSSARIVEMARGALVPDGL
jgi:hypothetical protein